VDGVTRFAAGSTSSIVSDLPPILEPWRLTRPRSIDRWAKKKLELIRASGFRSFPPRLPEQPIFYPVLSEEYATQIARDWNRKDERSGFVGYVLRFAVRTEFLSRYEIHVVGSSMHREYWIPAGDLPEVNANVVGDIEVVSEFRGKK
jgi:hypothetical protein